MKYNIATLVSAILISSLFIGCNAPKPQKLIVPISKTIDKVKKITSFTHAKTNKDGKKFTKKEILNAVLLSYKEQITRGYGKSTTKTKNLIFKIFYSKIFAIDVAIKDMTIITTFKTQTCEAMHTIAKTINEKCKKITTMKYYSDVKFVSKKNKWDIQMSSVSRYETNAPANVEYFDKPEKLVVAVNNSLSHINNIAISSFTNMSIRGSLYSDYPIPAIKSSFDRALNTYTSKKSTVDGYEDSYYITINKERYNIFIRIFPYKKGNKVAYILNVPYDANKTSKKKIESKIKKLLKKKITSIVNM